MDIDYNFRFADLNDAGFPVDTWPTADNETLSIFQDFLVILDDPARLNESIVSGDNTINNIINSIGTNGSDFKIIFDPSQKQFQGTGLATS